MASDTRQPPVTREEAAKFLAYENGQPTIRNLTPEALDYVTEWMRLFHLRMWPVGRRGRQA